MEAYQRGRLIAVLPFMQKLLECCKVRGEQFGVQKCVCQPVRAQRAVVRNLIDPVAGASPLPHCVSTPHPHPIHTPPVQDSKVFRATNPMISGILSILAELHSLKGLKINNVFCIELVFKAFSIVAEDVKPTDMLRKVRLHLSVLGGQGRPRGMETLSAGRTNE